MHANMLILLLFLCIFSSQDWVGVLGAHSCRSTGGPMQIKKKTKPKTLYKQKNPQTEGTKKTTKKTPLVLICHCICFSFIKFLLSCLSRGPSASFSRAQEPAQSVSKVSMTVCVCTARQGCTKISQKIRRPDPPPPPHSLYALLAGNGLRWWAKCDLNVTFVMSNEPYFHPTSL